MNPKSQAESSLSNPSPYPLREDNISVYFVTDSGVVYRLFFVSDSTYLPGDQIADLTFSFSIVPVNGPDTRKDIRIRPTIAEVLRLTFSATPNVIILFTCSTDNAQEVARGRLFNAWYLTSGTGYTKLDHTDSAEQAITSAIFRDGHPLEEQIQATFKRVYVDK